MHEGLQLLQVLLTSLHLHQALKLKIIPIS